MSQSPLFLFRNTVKLNHFIKKKMRYFDKKKKTLLFIEPYGAVCSLLNRALNQGYQVIVLTANTDLRRVSPEILERVHLAFQVDTAQEEQLRELAQLLKKQCQIDAIIPGFEYFVPTAARLSHDLALPGLLPEQTANFRSKAAMRVALQNAGLAVPQFNVVRSMQELTAALKRISFPAICKPTDAAGSVYVKRIRNADEAYSVAKTILHGKTCLWGHQISNSLLLEEYLDGKEYSAEGVIQNGKIHYFSFTEKFVADQVEFIEVGHIANSPLSSILKKRITAYLDRVLRVLQADHCPFHAEFRLDRTGQPVLMEVAARLPGDRIADLVCLAREVNYLDAVLACYLGEQITTPEMKDHYAGIRFFYRPELDHYSAIEGLEKITEKNVVELSIYYPSQERIPVFPKALRRLGHVILKSHDYEGLGRSLAAIDDGLIFKT